MSSIKKTKSIIRANNTTAPVLLGGILTSSNAVATPLVYLLLFDAPFQIALDGTAFNPGGNATTYGSGGGGASTNVGFANGGNGKQGVVILSYPIGVLNATGGTVTTFGGNMIHTFTSNDNFVVNNLGNDTNSAFLSFF